MGRFSRTGGLGTPSLPRDSSQSSKFRMSAPGEILFYREIVFRFGR